MYSDMDKKLHIFLKHGYGEVELPYALESKQTNAKNEWCWQYVFPAKNVSTCPRTVARRRHHTPNTKTSTINRIDKNNNTLNNKSMKMTIKLLNILFLIIFFNKL